MSEIVSERPYFSGAPSYDWPISPGRYFPKRPASVISDTCDVSLIRSDDEDDRGALDSLFSPKDNPLK